MEEQTTEQTKRAIKHDQDFLEVLIPLYLKDIPNYYIKGGRAYDYYFFHKLGSIDYDIIISRSSFEILSSKLLEHAKAKGYKLNYPLGNVINLSFQKMGKKSCLEMKMFLWIVL